MLPKNSFTQLGVKQFQAGNLLGAEYFLNEAINAQPSDFDATLLLGLVRVAQSNPQAAVPLFLKAFSLKPQNISAALNLAQAYSSIGDFSLAVEVYDSSLKIHQNNLELSFGLAVNLANTGEIPRACEIYKNILRVHPDAIDARLNLAALLADSGDFNNALLTLKAVTKNSKLNKTYWSNLAAIYLGLKKWKEAEHSIKKSILMDEGDPQLLIRGGEIMLGNGNPLQAREWFEKAISYAPKSADAWTGLGNAMLDLGQTQEAAIALSNSLELNPDNAVTWCVKGTLFMDTGDYAEAMRCLEIARKIAPLMPEVLNNTAHLSLRACNFLDGWRDYEFRWRVGAFTSRQLFTDEKRWFGEELSGNLLVWGEQGIGDQILYASMLNMLSQKTKKIIVLIDYRLLPILRRSMPDISFLPMETDISSISFEKQISLGSLGQYLLNSKTAFKERKYPYLFSKDTKPFELVADPNIVGKKICGLSWTSKAPKYSSEKSFNLEDLRPIFEISSLAFLDVGYANTFDERESIEQQYGVKILKVNEIDSFNDIESLAILIDSCNFVITCSNTCAHLAGALGKKTFLLVPRYRGRFWYWNDIDGDSLWYPSVTIIPKDAEENWVSVAQRVKNLVENFI